MRQLASLLLAVLVIAFLYVASLLVRGLPTNTSSSSISSSTTTISSSSSTLSSSSSSSSDLSPIAALESEVKRLRNLEATLADWDATLKAKQDAFERREARVERDLAQRFSDVETKLQTLAIERAAWLQDQRRVAFSSSSLSSTTTTSTSTTTSTPPTTTSAPPRTLAPIRPLNFSSPPPAFPSVVDVRRPVLPPPTRLADYLATLPRSAVRKSAPLNVLIVTFELSGGPKPAGGIGTAYQQLALALAGAGHRVVVLLSSAFRVDELEWTPWVQRLAAKGIELEIAPFPELPLTNTGCGWSCIKSYCIFEWLKRQLPVEFDVIHFPENLGLAYFPLLAKRQGLALQNSAFVVGLHGPHVWEREANQKWMDSLFDFEVVYQERKVAEWADWAVSPSAFLVDWLQRTQYWHLPPGNRTLVHQNIITDMPSTARDDDGRPPVDRSLPTAADDIRELVFFGRLETRKGVMLMVDAIDSLRLHEPKAARQLHEVTLTFLGKDPQSASVQIGKRCAEWRGAPSCQFELDQERASALQYLQGPGRVAVIPSLTENSPYTVMECAHLRVPLLASRVGGIPELLDHTSAQLYTFRPEPRDLARVLAQVLLGGITPSALAHAPDATQREWIEFTERAAWSTRVEPPLAAPPARRHNGPTLSVVVAWLLPTTENEVRALLKRVGEAASFAARDSFETIVVASSEALSNNQRLTADPTFVAAKARIVTVPGDALTVGEARNKGALEAASGEFLLFLDTEDYFRGSTALSQLLHLAQSRQLDVATAQVLITGQSGLTPDSDVSRIDTVAWVRSVELFLGCVDDAALGLFLNCYGETNALIRREPFVALGGFDSNEAGVDSEPWSLFAAFSLAGYRLETHVDVLFARPTRVFPRPPGESVHAQLSRPIVPALAALRNSPMRMSALYTSHLHFAFEEARENHRQALSKLQAKYAQRTASQPEQARDDGSAALRTELDSMRARLADAIATQGDLQRSLDEARRDASRRVPPARAPATTAPAIDGPSRDELLKENEDMRRKLAKKFPSATTTHAGAPASTPASMALSTSSTRPPGVVVVHDEGGREVHQRIVLLRGHEKSGTTWLRQLMSLHPRINMAPKEFQFNFVQSAVDRFTKEPWMGATPSLSRLAHFWCDEFVHAMLGAVAAKQPDKLWIGEKSPKAIDPVMPGAHYIYIVRDGRDVLVSLFWHHVRIGGFKTWCDGGVPVAAADSEAWKRDNTYFDQLPHRLLALEKCVRITARIWKQVVEADLALIAELNRIEKELPNHANNTAMVASGHTRAIIVAYESLLENTDSERRRLYEFLALDPSEARALAAEDLTLPGVPHERSDAFFRKGVQGDWKQYFHDDAKQWFKEEAGELLERLGYVAKGENW